MQTSRFSRAQIGRLRVKHLDLFKTVMEQHTLQRAAALTYMTQPAATKLVQEMEDIFGVPLFQRGKRGMTPTYHAEVAYRHISTLLSDLLHMERELDLVSEGGEGHIRLGILPSLAPDLITTAIVRMLTQHPKVRFTLREATTTELLESLLRNELDMTFGRILDKDAADGLRFSNVYEESFAIVSRSDHPLAQGKPPSWKTLSRFTWILPAAGTPMRNFVDGLFSRNAAFRPSVAVECTTLEKVRNLVAQSDMLGLLPRTFAMRGEIAGRLSIIRSKIGSHFTPISLISRPEVEPSPAMQEFERIVCAVAREAGLH